MSLGDERSFVKLEVVDRFLVSSGCGPELSFVITRPTVADGGWSFLVSFHLVSELRTLADTQLVPGGVVRLSEGNRNVQ